jgi:hypothetical protein
MTIEVTILISVVSVSAAIFFGIKSLKRANKQDTEQQTEIIRRQAEALEQVGAVVEECDRVRSELLEVG